MAYALLEVVVNSARSLEDVRVLGDMKVYIVVSLSTDPQTTQKSHVDIHGETNPSWNFKMKFFFDALNLRNPNFELVFELKCQRSFGGDKGVGEVRVPVRDLLVRAASQLGSVHVVTLPVTGRRGRRKGSLTFSYLFARAGLMPGVPEQQVPILESDYAKLLMVDENGNTSPTWNSTMNSFLNDCDDDLQHELRFQLYCKRSRGDACVGEVSFSIKELFARADMEHKMGLSCTT